eukprot:353118-Chlamydomonas_euryale.AAC.4
MRRNNALVLSWTPNIDCAKRVTRTGHDADMLVLDVSGSGESAVALTAPRVVERARRLTGWQHASLKQWGRRVISPRRRGCRRHRHLRTCHYLHSHEHGTSRDCRVGATQEAVWDQVVWDQAVWDQVVWDQAVWDQLASIALSRDSMAQSELTTHNKQGQLLACKKVRPHAGMHAVDSIGKQRSMQQADVAAAAAAWSAHLSRPRTAAVTKKPRPATAGQPPVPSEHLCKGSTQGSAACSTQGPKDKVHTQQPTSSKPTANQQPTSSRPVAIATACVWGTALQGAVPASPAVHTLASAPLPLARPCRADLRTGRSTHPSDADAAPSPNSPNAPATIPPPPLPTQTHLERGSCGEQY